MSTVTVKRATLDDLMKTEGKAELIGGRIVPFMATGVRPNQVASNIFVSLRIYTRQTKRGEAFTDNLGYAVPELPSGRESFSPDTSYYEGPMPTNRMWFVENPPNFAVEVRSECDYGNAADRRIGEKRTDYFLAGTQVVWDVDPRAETIACYRADAPDQPTIWRRGETADAEPAVPGWRIAVDEVFA